MKNILVVDDEPAVRRLLVHLLGLDGYDVTEAENGHAALKWIQGSTPPDLCVLDVMMPKVDGWEVLSTVRADEATADLRVIMLTAKGQPRDRLLGWELGCDAYIPKPFEPQNCLDEVRAVMVRSERERTEMREAQLNVVRSMMVSG